MIFPHIKLSVISLQKFSRDFAASQKLKLSLFNQSKSSAK